MSANLSNEEIENCRVAFNKFDKDGSGSISDWELRAMLQSMGQDPSDEELFDMIAAVDDDGSGEIDFGEFCMVIANQKAATAAQSDESDTLDAFMALGGATRNKEGEVVKDDEGKIKDPKGGAVSADKLRHIIKEFDLRIDIDRLIAEVDTDKSGVIEYDEFAHMMKS